MKLPSLSALFSAKKPDTLTRDLATSRFVSWYSSVPDADEVMKRLGYRRSDLRMLLRDPEVAQCVDTRLDAVVSTPWRVEPNSTRAGKWIAEQLAPHIESIVNGAFEAVLYGYSVMEAVWKTGADGRITLDRIQSKPMEWFEYRRGAESSGWWCRLDGGEQFQLDDPRKWFVTVRRPTYLSPTGDPLLSRCWFPVWFKTEGLKQWVQFLETFGSPILVGNTTAYEAFVERMQELGAKRAFAWPDGKIETVNASSPGEFSRHIDAMNGSIQKLILGQSLTSEVGSTGSYAAAKVHNEVRTDKRNSDLRLVASTVQAVVNQLAALNGLQATEFVMADDTGLEMDRATRDALLVEKGVLTLTPEYLLDRYDYRDGDFEIPEKIQPENAENPQKSAANMGALRFSADEPREFTPGQQAVEAQVFEALDSDGQPIPLDLIRDAIAGAADADDLRARLALLLDKTDPSFMDLLARAQFAASVLGYVNADEHVS